VGFLQSGGVQPGVERAVGREDGGRRHVAVGRELPCGRHCAAAAHRVQLRHQGAPFSPWRGFVPCCRKQGDHTMHRVSTRLMWTQDFTETSQMDKTYFALLNQVTHKTSSLLFAAWLIAH